MFYALMNSKGLKEKEEQNEFLAPLLSILKYNYQGNYICTHKSEITQKYIVPIMEQTKVHVQMYKCIMSSEVTVGSWIIEMEVFLRKDFLPSDQN